jgi:uncharacterized membrane protein YfcA
MSVERKFGSQSKSAGNLTLKPNVRIKIDEKVTIHISFWALALSGGVIGFLRSTMGVGGGFILLPILIYMVKLPLPIAAGTSLFTLLISGFYGAGAYIVSKNIDWAGVFYMTVTSVAGTVLGTAATKKVGHEKIKVLFTITLFLGGIAVLFKEINFDLISNVFVFTVIGVTTLMILYTAFIKDHFKKITIKNKSFSKKDEL